MREEGVSGGPLDIATLTVLGQRAATHPLVERWALKPDTLSPRRLELSLDASQYPPSIENARLDVRWFEGGDYTLHYVESWVGDVWQCRWDRHPKSDAPREHVHPPPTASSEIEPSEIGGSHHLDVLFFVLDWVAERVEELHDG